MNRLIFNPVTCKHYIYISIRMSVSIGVFGPLDLANHKLFTVKLFIGLEKVNNYIVGGYLLNHNSLERNHA